MAYALFPLTEDQGGGTERSIHAHVCMDVSVHARRHVCPNVFVHVHGGGDVHACGCSYTDEQRFIEQRHV